MNQKITLVTGNKNKLLEFQKILGSEFKLENIKINLPEIQSLKLEEICEYKVKEAYKQIQKPVIVEDTEFCLEALNGLPGPFIKFFEEKLGKGASIKLLKGHKNKNAKQICCIAYFDGKNISYYLGEINGTISNEIKEGYGFGFDFCFIPNGYKKTFSELGLIEKNKISARKLAIENFKKNFN